MTEHEWLTADDPAPMLAFARDKASDRKLRLFAVACCRRKSKYFTDPRCTRAVDIAERFSDDHDAVGDLDRACLHAMLAFNEWREKQGSQGLLVAVCSAAHAIAQTRLHVQHIVTQVRGLPVNSARARTAESLVQASLFRDVFGNPFRPVAFDPAWRTDTAVTLGRQMYDSREFGAMPILADALQEAGCDSDDVLNHCREATATHVRGCWVLDLVLGKE